MKFRDRPLSFDSHPANSHMSPLSSEHMIHADTQQVDEVSEDDEPLQAPTFVAAGD